MEEKDELIQKLIKEKEELTRAKEEGEKKAKLEVEKSYREFEQSKDRMVQAEKLAFAGRMASSVAHEIRNPLSMMVMSVQLLQNQLAKKAPQRELADIIMRNLTRIDHLVTELVNCARPPKLKIRHHNIHAVINSVITTIKEKCKAQKIKIVKEFTPEAPKVRIDKEHIEQAILNIVKNAVEAMPEGGTLTLATECGEDAVSINIMDTGKEIPGKDIIRIFDPFYTTKKGGTGLGLAVAYATIASHNGFINFKSKKGETCFTIKLPL